MKNTVMMLIPIAVLTGCSTKLDCGSTDTKNLVSSIIQDNEMLIKGWQLVMAGKGLEAANKFKNEKKEELNAGNLNIQSILSSISSQEDICKSELMASDLLKKNISEIEAIKLKVAELESFKPVQPKRFFWSANSTQQQHDEWRSAQDKYELDVNNKQQSLQKLYAEGNELIAKYKTSESFINQACESATRNQNLLSNDVIESIEHNMRKKVDADVLTMASNYINQKFSIIFADLERERLKINTASAAIDDEANSIYEKAANAYKQSIQNLKYNFDNIVTSSKDDKTGRLTCEADISATIDAETKVGARFTYRLEKTDDKKLYATIINFR